MGRAENVLVHPPPPRYPLAREPGSLWSIHHLCVQRKGFFSSIVRLQFQLLECPLCSTFEYMGVHVRGSRNVLKTDESTLEQ